MDNAKERLVQWLRDAHAMEEQAETMLNGQAGRLEHYPELKARIQQHLEETKRQAQKLEQCLERVGNGASTMKDAAGKMAAMGQAMGGMFAGDEVVKGAMASYVFEHMEIASYRVLIATAEQAGDMETQRVCQEILREEEAMASWLENHLPDVTRQFLAREQASGATAKR